MGHYDSCREASCVICGSGVAGKCNCRGQLKKYDSTQETLDHIEMVQEFGGRVLINLNDRFTNHDYSKLHPPEKEVFDKYTPKLTGSTYGSDEYKGFLKGMGVALDHHYAENSHHPEHHKHLYCPHCETSWNPEEESNLDGVCPLCGENKLFITGDLSQMSLLSLLEMITDWKSATMRDDGDILKSIIINQERFGYSDDIRHILYNTIIELGWED
jgi:hypothetical protein